MLNSTASLWLGVAFVLIGAINVWLILQASARVRDALLAVIRKRSFLYFRRTGVIDNTAKLEA